MNILVIHEVDYMRKVVYDLQMLAEAMSLRGHDVYVIDYESMRNGTKSPSALEVSRVFPDAKVHLIRTPFVKIAGLSRVSASFMQIGLIKKIIREKGIDVVVLYSVPTNGLPSVYWAKKYGVPVIFRSLDVLNQLVTIPALRPITKFMERLVYSRVDLGLTITPKLSEYLSSLGAKKTQVLLMPVDTNAFYPFKSDIGKKWGIAKADKAVLFMGTLFNFSGLDYFITKFWELLQSVPEAKLLIVGDGPQREKLMKLSQEYEILDRVVITGFQPYGDMAKYINLADVCILPFEVNNVTRDIFPGKIVQYLACGKPLVSTNLDGVREVIKSEEQGVVYVKDISEMVREVSFILRHPLFMHDLGDRGLRYVRKNHDAKKMAEQLELIVGGLR